MKHERRDIGGEIRMETAEGKTTISGLGAAYYRADDPGTEYQLWDGAVDRIMPGAFDRAIQEGDDVRGLFNHDANLVLGRTKSGTMRLRTDGDGLRYEIDLADTSIARDVATHLERGDVTGSSFGFNVTAEEWRKEDGIQIREIHGVRLFDVSPVTYPAYEGTSSAVRDAEGARESFEFWEERNADQDDTTQEPADTTADSDLARLKLRAVIAEGDS